MPSAEEPEQPPARLRLFVGRHPNLVVFLLGGPAGALCLVAWHVWDVELLEYRWFQGLLILVFSAAVIPLQFWGEGALRSDPGGKRRSRSVREAGRRHRARSARRARRRSSR